MGGYGIHINKNGISELDEVVFDTENMVPLIGVQYAMEMIFGISKDPSHNPISIPRLDTIMELAGKDSILLPDTDVAYNSTMPYPYLHKVCLFGIGTDGADYGALSVREVKYYDTRIGENLDEGEMIPFRYTNDSLSPEAKKKYFGKKKVNEVNAYYLKKFDSPVHMFHLYKNGEADPNGFYSDGNPVDGDYFSMKSPTGVESFAECRLTIDKTDAREWFQSSGSIEDSRVNTIALFSGVYDERLDDYAYIQMFSKLNIPTEPLSLTKDMNIIYRTYGA